MLKRNLNLILLVLGLSVFGQSLANEKRPLTLPDIMKFREIKQVSVSDNGEWMSYVQHPDRGDPSGHVVALDNSKVHDIPLANKAKLSNDGSWAGFVLKVPMLDMEKANKKEKKKLKTGGLLLNTATGEQKQYERVKAIDFSGDNQFALVHLYPPEKDKDKDKEKTDAESAESKTTTAEGEEPASEEKADDKQKHHLKEKMLGSKAVLVDLTNGTETTIEYLQAYAFAEEGSGLAYVIVDKDGENNQLVIFDTQKSSSTVLAKETLASFPHLAFSKTGEQLAFLQGSYNQEEKQRTHQLFTYEVGDKKAKAARVAREGWFISHDNKLTWSEDEQRLFFGEKPVKPEQQKSEVKIAEQDDLFDTDKIVTDHSLIVWHGDDPWIKTHEANEYEDEQKRFYLSLYNTKRKRHVPLTDVQVRNAKATHNDKAMVVSTDMPYRKQRTWAGHYSDFYHVELKSGERQLIESRMSTYTDAEVSPSGRYVSYYHQGAIWLFDSRKGTKQNLSEAITTSFANELHDYPSPAPGYGIAGWLEKDKGVLVYDRYDIWLFSPDGDGQNLTKGDGRERKVEYRIIKTDDDQQFFGAKDKLLVKAYYDQLKHFGFYQLDLNKPAAPVKLLEDKKKYNFVAKAENADVLLYTREDMGEFPDLWFTKDNFANTTQLTQVNPQINEFLWGEPELVEWRSSKGKPLQGILIKPADYQPGQRYPVLVYYYRYFSQRMYAFNQMKVNHRPNFPYYTGNGYAVFLPDIKFDIGTPGPSATDALVPGIQKIIDMGIADEDAIGLHGHSWSGYQTAYAITETDIFKAAVAGAPVSNMTSAYSGIRLGSGLARQFQYEQTQSRIGGTLFDKLELYIENSPVFYADRINTPLLIQFGDVDDAVPWQQGIELYLAMRRLDKPVIMLQYQDEPHHLKKYANKVDYTQKMKAFFDHHLKGEPAPLWMAEGVPFSKKDKAED